MVTSPNSFSFLRAPLAFVFIIESTWLRTLVIILAMLSDYIDGYLARRYKTTSRFGAILDPIMDKFFVYVTLAVLFYEGHVTTWQIATMLSRDFFLLLFMFYLTLSGTLKSLQVKAIRWGKVTTASQFIVLLLLVQKLAFPNFLYFLFILFGSLAFLELLYGSKKRLSTDHAQK